MKALRWTDILWGPIPVTVATVALAVLSVIGVHGRSWLLVAASAAFIIVHSVANSVRDQSIVRRLGHDYDRVQHRAVQIVADLGQLVGDQFDLWMVDLYLPKWRLSGGRSRPYFVRELSRELSVSLVDSRPQPGRLDPIAGPHGESFSSGAPILWFHDALNQGAPGNAWSTYDDATNDGLADTYGVLNVLPIVDQLGKKCVGVLAVHVAPEPDVALHALGALTTAECKRRLSNACVELNGILGA